MSAITLADIRLGLAGLNGESSVPNDTARDYHIQRTIEDITYRYHWSWRKVTVDITFTNKVATLPSDFTTDSFPYDNLSDTLGSKATLVNASGDKYNRVNYDDRFLYGENDKVFYVSGNSVDGYTATIFDSSTTLSMTYFRSHDVLTTATDTTRIPLLTPIASGAFMYFVRKQDIDRNINQERVEYEAQINKLFTLESSNIQNKLISSSAQQGYSIGGI